MPTCPFRTPRFRLTTLAAARLQRPVKHALESVALRGALLLAIAIIVLPLGVGACAASASGSDATRQSSYPGTAADEAGAAAASTDWPMYQHDPTHSGRTPATVTNTGPLYLQWAYSFGERVEVEAQPVVANGVIYQGVMNGEMHAINATTGQALWIVQPGGPIAHTAAVVDSVVYVGSLDGNVYALSTSDGHTLWQYSTDGPVVSAPVVVDGRVFIGSNDGGLYALDATTGARLWRYQTDGPVASSPAVSSGRVYFGSEDLKARCVNASSGALVWEHQLYGANTHNTHPVISDDAQVVIFVTAKPGVSSYVPLEGYPAASSSADPVATWNSYYQSHPTYRTLYYLNAATGADLWNSSTRRYVPMPIPYWGLIEPILASDGSAWFPAPAGTNGYATGLDHDDRLFRIDLSTGVTTQQAGGSMSEYQARSDETGRHIFSGSDYYYTVSEDLAVYRPSGGTLRVLFSNGDASGYNFGTHMQPLSPLPSRHLWRYGGAIAMGGVPGASQPIVANGMVYYNSYSWLYAVGPTDRGLNPATSFSSRDARLYELTYPRTNLPSLSTLRSELAQRVADIVALGPSSPPITARWDQTGNETMLNNEFSFEVYGFEADLVRVLSEALPFLPGDQQTQLKAYLKSVVSTTLLDSQRYNDTVTHCVIYGQSGVKVGDDVCRQSGQLAAVWWSNNPNLVGMRLYALWAYADATGDWQTIENSWSLISQQLQVFTKAYNSQLGFCLFDEWRVGRLNIGAQIQAAQALRDMAAHVGDTSTRDQAQTLLTNLLNGRIALANFVPQLYATGARTPASIRLNADGTIVYEDIMGPNSPYNAALIPYDAALRDRNTDTSQVNWWDGSTYRVDSGVGFMTYQALSGYFPLSSSLVTTLRSNLLAKTQYYVKTYEVNDPWWWMSDLAHATTCSGEHLYHSPTLAWTLFQVKAQVLQEDWHTLLAELPEAASANSRYDLYRLENLATLLSLAPRASMSSTPYAARQDQTVQVTIVLEGLDGSVTLNNPLPSGLQYVTGSAQVTPQSGTLSASSNTIQWTGTLSPSDVLTLTYRVRVTTSSTGFIVNTATLQDTTGSAQLTAVTMANPFMVFMPQVTKKWTS